jgi:hypothetical protein
MIVAVMGMTGRVRADDSAEFFHSQVEPILRRHCFECHSHASGQMENGLALDWKSGWTTGGKRGPAIAPHKPDESLLIRAVEHRDPDLKMPEEKLTQSEIDVLVEWVRQGAFDDRVAAPQGPPTDDWWSLKPLVAPPVPGDGTLHPSRRCRHRTRRLRVS